MALSVNIETHRGDDDYFKAVVYEPDSTDTGAWSVRDITNDTMFFAVREDEEGTSTNYVFSKSSANSDEIEKTDPTNGEYKVYWDAADTSSLEIKDYFYAVEIIDSDSKRHTILTGIFKILPDIIRE
jgi:hypothetical protein